MRMESTEQQMTYLQADIAKLKNIIDKLKINVDHNLEYFGVNIKNLCTKGGHELLHKRPCEKCDGRGKIMLPVKPADPGASVDCTGGVSLAPSEPCTACDLTGIIWK